MEQVKFDLGQISQQWATALEAMPDLRRTILDAAGDEMLAMVRHGIGGTGKAQHWQEKRLGSKGGYVAVRPSGQDLYSGGNYQMHITTAIENDHRIRQPTGTAKRYVQRIRVRKVPGKYMYRAANSDLPAVAGRYAQQLGETLARRLEGKG